MSIRISILLLATAAALLLGCRKQPDQPVAALAATNSLLECAAKDLLGESTAVLRLAEPGMCPGHFDIRPSQVEQLRRCRVLLRLDFQQSLDAKLAGVKNDGPHIAEIRITGGLCEPDSYLEACRQTADTLVAAGLLDRTTADRRLREIDQRVRHAAECCQRNVEAIRGLPVIASAHQESFCRWLGLNVIATFTGADMAGASQLDRAIRDGEQAGARLVIANLPEGRRVANALAERLKAKVIVFGNFPTMHDGQNSFDSLLEANVAVLAKAAGK